MLEGYTKSRLYSFIVGIFCACIIMSNILATKTLKIDFIILPCSILAFPLLFVLNDILSEIYGYKLTKHVIYLGFLLNILAVTLYSIAIILPSNSPNASAFETILGTTPRIVIAGLCSYLLGNLLNSKVLIKLKHKMPDYLFVRCIGSTIIGEFVDSFIFISIVFIGTFSINIILVMICCQVVFKVLYEIIMYPVTRKVIFFLRKLDDGELEGELSSVSCN